MAKTKKSKEFNKETKVCKVYSRKGIIRCGITDKGIISGSTLSSIELWESNTKCPICGGYFDILLF
jgi:hypothetical protein